MCTSTKGYKSCRLRCWRQLVLPMPSFISIRRQTTDIFQRRYYTSCTAYFKVLICSSAVPSTIPSCGAAGPMSILFLLLLLLLLCLLRRLPLLLLLPQTTTLVVAAAIETPKGRRCPAARRWWRCEVWRRRWWLPARKAPPVPALPVPVLQLPGEVRQIAEAEQRDPTEVVRGAVQRLAWRATACFCTQ